MGVIDKEANQYNAVIGFLREGSGSWGKRI